MVYSKLSSEPIDAIGGASSLEGDGLKFVAREQLVARGQLKGGRSKSEQLALILEAERSDALFLTGLVARTFTAPFYVTSTVQQVTKQPARAVQVLQELRSTMGVKGLFRGNVVNCLRPPIAEWLNPYIDSVCSFVLRPFISSEDLLDLAVNNASALASLIVIHPLSIMKTRMTVQDVDVPHYRELGHAMYTLVSEEGVMALYQGLAPTLLGYIPHVLGTLIGQEALATLFPAPGNDRGGKKDKAAARSSMLQVAAGLVIGVGCHVISYPFDLIIQRMHIQSRVWGQAFYHAEYTNMIECMQTIIREEGALALWNGALISSVKGIPYALVSFASYEIFARLVASEQDGETIDTRGNLVRSCAQVMRALAVGYVCVWGTANVLCAAQGWDRPSVLIATWVGPSWKRLAATLE